MDSAESRPEQIKRAPDLVDLDHWVPPRQAVFPHIRLGKRWFNVIWLLPLSAAALVIAVAVVRELRHCQFIEEFIVRYPGHLDSPVAYAGFPLWLRVQHFVNIFLMMFIIRSGIQILADHPRLYWNKNSTPGTEWFRFQHEVPKDRIWTAKDDAVSLPSWFGIPGIRHSIGLARWWHFSCDMFWLLNGLTFYVLLFCTGQWQRIVPSSLDVLPNAISMMIQYLSLEMPHENGWLRYNSLQQLAYFITVFIAAPFAAFTGLMQSPAIANRFGMLAKLFNRQSARSIHFILMLWFIQFIVVHVTMVFLTGVRRNLNHITLGNDSLDPTGLAIAAVGLAAVFAAWIWVSPFTLANARLVQTAGRFLVGWLKGLMEMYDPKVLYEEKDIAPVMWTNGRLPDSDEFKEACKDNYANYRLKMFGLVEEQREFSYPELLTMPRREQITAHYCIQGWSGVAKWAGVPFNHLIDLVKPLSEARYVVFYSFGEGGHGGVYYDVHKLSNMRHESSILAYEMNGSPLTVLYGAPLRLRCENELGFKMVKWISAVEFVDDFSDIGSGQGGYNEDHEFFGYRMPI